MTQISKKLVLSALLVTSFATFSHAQGGMWMPSQLSRQEDDMKKLGLKIPVSDIYNDTGNSLNNAVVIFGGGCTGEIISSKGLLLTNHHCGYGTVQRLSTPEKNYLDQGFWAKNMEEEIPCPGLTVTFVRKSDDVTNQVLAGVSDTMEEAIRNKKIADNISFVEKAYSRLTGYKAQVKSFFNGNQYFVELKEVFRDVRLVGFPPEGIGGFGGDTDNWMWPQQKGDFSVFRVYADKSNQPADYNINNVPYNPKQFFTISVDGYKEGDMAMVYGFPYVTQEYITSYQLNQIQNISYPIRIAARGLKLGVWEQSMAANPTTNLKYAAKYSGISNGYKKWQGALMGLQINNVMSIKKEQQSVFNEYAVFDGSHAYAKMLLPEMEAAVASNDELLKANEYYAETLMGIEAISQSSILQKILNVYRADIDAAKLSDTLQQIKKQHEAFIKDYDVATDKKVFQTLMPMYFGQTATAIPEGIKGLLKQSAGNYSIWANLVYDYSAIVSSEKMQQYFNQPDYADTLVIKEDPAFKIYNIASTYRSKNILPKQKDYEARMSRLERLYVNRMLAYNPEKKNYYPDANQTLRLTYGPVKGITPIGGHEYSFQTNIDEEMERHDPNSTEFNIPKAFREVYAAKDFGVWAVNGTVPVNFISINHTSGGNSGSPALNKNGELIGINFDRIWDGTMSDNYFDPRLCRNVMVDIRYVLFVIEKYGKAGWLLNEMKFNRKLLDSPLNIKAKKIKPH